MWPVGTSRPSELRPQPPSPARPRIGTRIRDARIAARPCSRAGVTSSCMLPAWAAVAIALGASAVGALAGIFGAYISLRIARLNLDHEATEAWRTRQLEAAEDFSVVWTAAVSSVGLVRGAVKGGDALSPSLDVLQQRHA